jgi:hypothetical protein
MITYITIVISAFLLLLTTVPQANAITPDEKQTCKDLDISVKDCIKVIQERAATEAAHNLALSKIIPKTVNYVVQIVTSDSTTWSGSLDLADINGTGNQTYTVACSTTIAPIGYYVNAKIASSADNPPSLTLNLLYNGQIVNSTTVHQDFVDATIANSGCPSPK